MAQPEFVPIIPSSRVRSGAGMPAAEAWHAVRPGDLHLPGQPSGARLGHQGPDVGYGLKLANRFRDQLQLTEGEDAEDAIAGAFAVGARRASLFGRAPMIYDMQLAFTLFGFLGGAPDDLVAFRRPLFAAASHHYWDQREIVDCVRESTLRLRPSQVRERLGQWTELLLLRQRD